MQRALLRGGHLLIPLDVALAGSTRIASGRFAMIDDGIGFQLVPWQPVLDKRIGQHISGMARAAGVVEWSFGRKRGLGI